jgi:hypothetical protein
VHDRRLRYCRQGDESSTWIAPCDGRKASSGVMREHCIGWSMAVCSRDALRAGARNVQGRLTDSNEDTQSPLVRYGQMLAVPQASERQDVRCGRASVQRVAEQAQR